jgi:hypothetical protein
MIKIDKKTILALSVPLFFCLFAFFGSCQKELEKTITQVKYDTTTVFVHDTTIISIHDTTIFIITVHDTTIISSNDTVFITQHDTTFITIQDTIFTSLIIVDTIYANPDSITQGGSVELTAHAQSIPPAGTNLYYIWMVDSGEIETSVGQQTIWTAPGEYGDFKITVYVTDGEYVGMEYRHINVVQYVPTITPYYVGVTTCSVGICHGNIMESWEGTQHARAWESLINSGHSINVCYPCHTVQDTIPGNGGFDEVPIEAFENVQCENCHGPGSDHLAGFGTPTIDYDEMACGKCHQGAHQPYLEDWQESKHSKALENHATSVIQCQGCHEGVAAAFRLSGDLSVFYASGSVGRPDPSIYSLEPIVCQSCHDSHGYSYPGQIRTVEDVPLVTANGESPIITIGGTGKICMHCHHARMAPEPQIVNGTAHFGPHLGPQADMMASKSAYHSVAAPGFVWAGPSHLNIQNSCTVCHMNRIEFGPTGTVVTGHSFEPTVAACTNCHGEINNFDDIMATNDFDGDGIIEGVQSEVQGLMDLLLTALVTSGLDTTTIDFHSALGDTTISTQLQREAGYNLVFVMDDNSKGIHNPDYSIQLLQQSFQYLTSTSVPNAIIVTRDNMVVAPF